jgi:hypothetical protein
VGAGQALSPYPKEAADFMLKEYDLLRDWRNDLVKTQESRVTVYLTVVAASVTALGLSISAKREFGADILALFPFVSALLALCILCVGIITFVRLVERSIETVIAIRGLNRIRAYFTSRYPEIAAHLILASFRPNDPSFWQAGLIEGPKGVFVALPQIVAIFNGFVVAVAIRVAAGAPSIWVWLYGGAGFIVSLLLQNWWFRHRLRQVEERYLMVDAPGSI